MYTVWNDGGAYLTLKYLVLLELEALGDDLALDDDTSYLDEVPAPADTIPGDKDAEGSRTQARGHRPSLLLQYLTKMCILSASL